MTGLSNDMTRRSVRERTGGAIVRAISQQALRFRYTLSIGAALGGASLAQPVVAPGSGLADHPSAKAASDFSVMTYNVKGLPWPVASGRPEALRQIGQRLAQLRAAGRQPMVVVLQEAFTAEAKSIGARAGYPYQVQGPYHRAEAGESEAAGGRWYLGETQPAELDSGLVVLSDLPITEVRRVPFPTGACAGYDCLAAKGVLLVTIEIPGRGTIAIAATHLNSRASSGAPYERTHAAYRRQTEFLARFLAQHRSASEPLVIAGDFNRGDRPARIAALTAALPGSREGLTEVTSGDEGRARASADARWIRQRARDMQLIYDGARTRIRPVAAEIPFGTERDGTMLSDHMGFTIHYRLTERPDAI